MRQLGYLAEWIDATPGSVMKRFAGAGKPFSWGAAVGLDDMIAIRSMMNLSLSFDHRVLDGLAATRFLHQVKSWLEQFGGASGVL